MLTINFSTKPNLPKSAPTKRYVRHLIEISALPAVAGVIGGVLGGIIMAKTHLRPPGAALFIAMSLVVSAVGLGIISFFDCPQLQMHGNIDEYG